MIIGNVERLLQSSIFAALYILVLKSIVHKFVCWAQNSVIFHSNNKQQRDIKCEIEPSA